MLKAERHNSFREPSFVVFFVLILTVFWGIGLITYTPTADAIAVPHQLGYEGQLKDGGGNDLSGGYAMTFRIYDALTGGNLVWSDSWNSVVVNDGYFSVSLGSSSTLDLAFDKPYWISIEVAGDGEMTPRQPINSVGYAYTADITYGAFSTSSAPATSTGGLYYNNTDGNLYVYDHISASWIDVTAGGSGALSAEFLVTATSSELSNEKLVSALGENLTIKGDDAAARTLTFGQTGTFDDLVVIDTGNFQLTSAGAVTVTSTLTVNATSTFLGNVGIGTSSPVERLEVAGGSAWFYPNTDGTEAVALSLGQFSDTTDKLLDIFAWDNSGNGVVEFDINRWDSSHRFTRGSADGDQTVAILVGSDTGQYFAIYDQTTETTNILLHANGDSYFNGGNVGIGTSTPESLVHLYSSASGTASGIKFTSDSGTHNANIYIDSNGDFILGKTNKVPTQFVLDDGGNVGIGTSTPATKLHVSDSSDVYFTLDSTANTPEVALKLGDNLMGTSFWWTGINDDGGHDYSIAYGTSFTAAASFLTVADSGNVGIGTTTPTENLEIYGDEPTIKLADDGGQYSTLNQVEGGDFRISRTGTGGYDFGIKSNGDIWLGPFGNVSVGTTTAAGTFHVSNASSSNALVVATSGNIGIGTSTPESLLHVYRDDSSTGSSLVLEQDGTGDAIMRFRLTNDQSWYVGADNTDNFFKISENSGFGSNVHFTVDTSGNVGIGTDSPNLPLLVKSSATNTNVLSVERADNTTDIFTVSELGDGSGLVKIIDANGNQDIWLNSGGVSYINTGSNFGIGTSSPVTLLHVDGTTDADLDTHGLLVLGPTNSTNIVIDQNEILARNNSASSTLLLNTDGGNVTFCQNTSCSVGINDNDPDFRFETVGTSTSGYLGVTNSTDGDIFTIDGSGNVGIGTSTPAANLYVYSSTTQDAFVVRTVDGSTVTIDRFGYIISGPFKTSNQAYWDAGTNAITGGYWGGDTNLGSNNNKDIVLYPQGTGDVLIRSADVGIGIGTSTPAMRLHVASSTEGNVLRLDDGTETCDLDPDGSVIETCTSDMRLKTNIRDADSVIPGLLTMRVREFEMIKSGDTRTGFIAQELLETNPELVSIGDDGYYRVRSLPQAVLIKAIQEQQMQVDDLAGKLAPLEATIEDESQSILISAIDSVGGFIFDGIVKARGSFATLYDISNERLASVANSIINATSKTHSFIVADSSKLEQRETESGIEITTYSLQSSRQEIMISGEAKLRACGDYSGEDFGSCNRLVDIINGGGSSAVVNSEAIGVVLFDEAFSALLDHSVPVRVIIAPTSRVNESPYVSDKSQRGFAVRGADGDVGDGFDWIIIGRISDGNDEVMEIMLGEENIIDDAVTQAETASDEPQTDGGAEEATDDTGSGEAIGGETETSTSTPDGTGSDSTGETTEDTPTGEEEPPPEEPADGTGESEPPPPPPEPEPEPPPPPPEPPADSGGETTE